MVPPLRLHHPALPPPLDLHHVAPSLDPDALDPPRRRLVDDQGGPRPSLGAPPAVPHARHGPHGAAPPAPHAALPRAGAPPPGSARAVRRACQARGAGRPRRGARRRGHALELLDRGAVVDERALLLEYNLDGAHLGQQVPVRPSLPSPPFCSSPPGVTDADSRPRQPLRDLPPPRRQVLARLDPAQGPLPRPHGWPARARRPPHLGDQGGSERGKDAQEAVSAVRARCGVWRDGEREGDSM